MTEKEETVNAAADEAIALAKSTYGIEQSKIWQMIERKDHVTLGSMDGISGLAQSLKVDQEQGVEASTLDLRRRCFGWNKFKATEPVSLFALVWEALQDRIVQILIVAAAVSIIFGMTLADPHTGEINTTSGWIEGTAILISVTVVVSMGAGNDYQKAKKFEELAKQQGVKIIQVVRGGTQVSVDSTEIVVGDIMLLETGMQIVCDGLLLLGQEVKTNESAMTGESDLMKKTIDGDCFLLSGTSVEEGTGKVLVIAVGMNSFQGKMKEKVDEGGMEETPLQAKLTNLADKVGKLGALLAVVLLGTLCVKEVIQITTKPDHPALATRFLRFLIVSVTVVVVCIPEGLPLAVTIALAFGMKAMMDDQCMVRILASCETMGAATAICSDKTGTLTTNVMTVVQGYVAGEEFAIKGFGLDIHDGMTTFDRDGLAQLRSIKEVRDIVGFAVAVNSTASEQVRDGQLQWVGNKTEFGLLGFVKRMGQDYAGCRASVAEANRRQYPFSSKKKRMTTIVRNAESGEVTTYCKGASEIILEDCNMVMKPDGRIAEMDAMTKAAILDVISGMANQGNRTIGVSMKVLGKVDFPSEEPTEPMVFIAVLGIQDPIRDAVPEAVRHCNDAGLIIRMVTGDNINTAIAIAKKANIYQEGGWDYAMTGPDFRKMYEENPTKLKELVPRLRVLARSSPTDKYILVHLLQEAGEVVGVTGDGTNDAPALKLSNVGFAMNTGTDIAKGAAHMILMDDNFATVVAAIKWGRAVNDNIRKFLQFQMTVNVAGCLMTFIGAVSSDNNEEPLKPVQLLWLNLIMDTLAALALATERPEEKSLYRAPVYQSAPLVSRKMACFIAVHAMSQLAVMLGLIFAGHKLFACNDSLTTCTAKGGSMDGGYCHHGPQHVTVIFNIFIWFQIVNELNARKLYGEWNPFEGIMSRSNYYLGVQVVVISFQIFAVEVAGDFMSTTGLRWQQWLGCIGFALLELPLGFLQRLIPITDKVPEDVLAREARDAELLRKLKFENPNFQGKSTSTKSLDTSVIHSRHGDPSLKGFRSDKADNKPHVKSVAFSADTTARSNLNNSGRSTSPSTSSLQSIDMPSPMALVPVFAGEAGGANNARGTTGEEVAELKTWLATVLRHNHDQLKGEISTLKDELHSIEELRSELAELRQTVARSRESSPVRENIAPTIPPQH